MKYLYLLCFTLISFQAYAVDVGFENSEFYVGVGLGDGTLKFSLCPDKLPKANKECFAISACEFSEEKLRKAVSTIVDDDFRTEMETLLGGSFVSHFKMDVFVPRLIELLKKVDDKKECVFVTDILDKILPKKKAEKTGDK